MRPQVGNKTWDTRLRTYLILSSNIHYERPNCGCFMQGQKGPIICVPRYLCSVLNIPLIHHHGKIHMYRVPGVPNLAYLEVLITSAADSRVYISILENKED